MKGCDPNEGNGEERERFWNDLEKIVDRVRNRYRLCVLGDMNGWIGDRMEFQERMIMEEEWWSSVLKGGCVWVTHTSNIRVYISTQGR